MQAKHPGEKVPPKPPRNDYESEADADINYRLFGR